jgi:hypothetical protein
MRQPATTGGPVPRSPAVCCSSYTRGYFFGRRFAHSALCRAKVTPNRHGRSGLPARRRFSSERPDEPADPGRRNPPGLPAPEPEPVVGFGLAFEGGEYHLLVVPRSGTMRHRPARAITCSSTPRLSCPRSMWSPRNTSGSSAVGSMARARAASAAEQPEHLRRRWYAHSRSAPRRLPRPRPVPHHVVVGPDLRTQVRYHPSRHVLDRPILEQSAASPADVDEKTACG